jgi:hypothetical protein
VEADLEAELIEDFGKLSRDPYRFVLYAFPWRMAGELADLMRRFFPYAALIGKWTTRSG